VDDSSIYSEVKNEGVDDDENINIQKKREIERDQ